MRFTCYYASVLVHVYQYNIMHAIDINQSEDFFFIIII